TPWPLSAWQVDPALASVRELPELAKLPDAEREPWRHLWRDVAAAVAADPLEKARVLAAHRNWAPAAAHYARVLERASTDDGEFWFEFAALSVLAGDRPNYARACSHLVERRIQTGGPNPYYVARTCTLAPDAVPDKSLPGRLVELELRTNTQYW